MVLTTSQAEEDVLRSYDLHANAYVTKPVDFDRFIGVVRGRRAAVVGGRPRALGLVPAEVNGLH